MILKQNNKEKGFSILELIVTILVSSLVLATIAPSYSKISSSMEKSMTLEQMRADFSRARSLAMSKGARVIFSVDQDARRYAFGVDYAPFNSPAARDSELFATSFPESIEIEEAETIIFGPAGRLIDSSGNPNQVEIELSCDGSNFANLTAYLSGFLEQD